MLKTAIPLEKATFQRELIYTIAKKKKRKNSSGTITEQDQSSESMNTAKPVLRQMNM